MQGEGIELPNLSVNFLDNLSGSYEQFDDSIIWFSCSLEVNQDFLSEIKTLSFLVEPIFRLTYTTTKTGKDGVFLGY